VPTEALVEQVS